MRRKIKMFFFWRKYRYYRKQISHNSQIARMHISKQILRRSYDKMVLRNFKLEMQIKLYIEKIIEYEKKLKQTKTSPEKCKIKRSFHLAEDARKTLKEWKKQNPSLFSKATIYQCNVCNRWHVTTNKGN